MNTVGGEGGTNIRIGQIHVDDGDGDNDEDDEYFYSVNYLKTINGKYMGLVQTHSLRKISALEFLKILNIDKREERCKTLWR